MKDRASMLTLSSKGLNTETLIGCILLFLEKLLFYLYTLISALPRQEDS